MKILSCPLYGHYGLSQEVDQSEGVRSNPSHPLSEITAADHIALGALVVGRAVAV